MADKPKTVKVNILKSCRIRAGEDGVVRLKTDDAATKKAGRIIYKPETHEIPLGLAKELISSNMAELAAGERMGAKTLTTDGDAGSLVE